MPHATPAAGIPGRLLSGGARGLAPLALVAAAGIHATQAARHLPDPSFHGRLHGAFFVAAAVVQLAAAAGAGPLRSARLVAAANLALAAAWAASVTVGLPSWAVPGGAEPVTAAGAAAAALEVAVAWVLVHRRRPGLPFALAGATAVAVVAVFPASGPGHAHVTAAGHSPAGHDAGLQVAGVHLHGLGGDAFDPGPDPARQARRPLAGERLRAGRGPAGVVVHAGAAWVTDRREGTVRRLDARTGRALGRPVPVGVHPGGIAAGEDGVWVANAGSDTVTHLDPATAEVLATIPVGRVPVGVAVGAGSVWVTNSAEGTVSRIDPATRAVSTSGRIGYGPTAITVAAGRPWVVMSLDRAVLSLDPETGHVLTTSAVGAGPAAIASGHGSLWVASSSSGTLTRLDPATGERAGPPILLDRRTQPGQGPAAVAVGQRVYVLNNHDNTIIAVDPATGAPSPPRFIGRRVARGIVPAALAIGSGAELWATDHERGRVVRLPS